ncbi:MAG TPA: chemotaxis protein CheB [Mycobacterium sp.]|nr:chemotaxis protein CheB [Mycobacterium sp.]
MARTATPAEGVVAIGASAGGIEALTELAAGMPANFPFAVMVVTHMGRGSPSLLPVIIDRSGPLPAVAAVDGAVLEAGRIYVAVPDHHLLVWDHRVALSDGPWESGRRPAIDALFRSVALDYGPRAIGVLMSGLLDDGVAGLRAIKAKGGVTVVQEPTDAQFPDLPRNAVKAGVADHAVAAKEIGDLLAQLADQDVEEQGMDPDGRLDLENQIAMGMRFATSIDIQELGPPTGYSCPNCKGTLVAVDENTYRCQVGHAWTTEALLLAHDHELEEALWSAIRIVKEKAKLCRELAESASGAADLERYTASADQAEHAIAVLGKGLFTEPPPAAGTPEEFGNGR